MVGTGFGGGVAACRLAEAGRSVCVLERGRRFPPGSFPRSPRDMARSFWDPSEGLHGMFDVWSFQGLEAIVASGLGGGSLIYANVLIRKDERWFVREDARMPGYEYWPVTRDDLEPHYDRAEAMLDATPYPFDHPPYDQTPKTRAFADGARRAGHEHLLPNLAVSFGGTDPVPGIPVGTPDDNLHGVQRLACRLCGECDIGCNYGSKNTVDLTYLSVAERHGAEIRDRCEVRAFRPLDTGGFEVDYVVHDPSRDGKRTPTRRLPVTTITTRVLVLAAGTLGSTYLLLANRDRLPGLGDALGTRFCGNGDLLGFVTRSDRDLDASRGPVITSAVRVADDADGNATSGTTVRGHYVEEGGLPGFADWLTEAASVGPLRRGALFAVEELRRRAVDGPVSRIGGRVGAVLGDGRRSSRRLPLLGMGRDVADGHMRLRDRWLDVDWTTESSSEYFRGLTSTMRALAGGMGGRFRDAPLTRLGRVVTVHPLGGAPMGRDAREGVVDDHGEVFGHPGLFVADGAVMPGPVGTNPALTIAALAERFSGRMIERSSDG